MKYFYRFMLVTLLLLSAILTSALLSQNEKLSIAVLNLDAHGISDYEVATLTDRLRNELFKTNVFRVMEREKMDDILKKQGFQQTGCTSSECLVQVGKLVGVKIMVGGSIGRVGGTYTVSLRLIDVETGEMVKTATRDVRGEIDMLLTTVMPQVAQELAGPATASITETKVVVPVPSPSTQTSGSTVGTVTDIDGNVYRIVKIGNQWWMAENLKVTRYRNGDAIPHVTSNSTWTSTSSGAYCAYNNDEANVAIYGRLYNWYAVNDPRGLAPAGWHVPSDAEWKTLVDSLGGSSVAGGKLKEAGTAHWHSPNTGATNSSGFSGLPGGYRNNNNGNFNNMGNNANFWSSSESGYSSAWTRELYYYDADISRYDYYKRDGFSVRCVRD